MGGRVFVYLKAGLAGLLSNRWSNSSLHVRIENVMAKGYGVTDRQQLRHWTVDSRAEYHRTLIHSDCQY
jgi:hypothetical protein